ncbi:MAG TPA: tetratricopeptide repeat protein [Gemmatimonadales bacterium]|jgi:tol-pal system protein YbgF|nr:tetratricopeptide repeat protein [Gemmatimonadales bacterium]
MDRRAASGLVLALAAATSLAGCVSKSDVQLVQGEVALLRAETLRRDSTRAAQLGAVLQMQREIMDSLAATRRTVAQTKGDMSQDLYNIQQQLVQLQELTGQSQQRLTELRTQLEARAAQNEPTPTGGPTPTGDQAQPTGASSASADQMYEASLAQLRRGSTSTARQGLRELLRSYPTSARAPDALYFIGQSFAAENPDSAAEYYRQVADSFGTSPRAPSALYNLGLLAERRKDTGKAKDAYQRVVQKYPQSDEAALARDRLKALGR